MRLADGVKSNPALVELLTSGLDWTETAQKLAEAPGGPAFLHAFHRFLDENGSRAVGEFELSLPRWHEDPAFVLNVLRTYLQPGQQNPSFAVDALERQEVSLDSLHARLGPAKGWLFNQMLRAYGRYAALRENLKYRLMQGYDRLRHAFLVRGNRLAAAGKLAQPEDIFFLTLAEIRSLEAPGSGAGLQPAIRERKNQHAHWRTQQAPSLASSDGRRLAASVAGAPWRGLAGSRRTTLHGIGSSPGEVVGQARVLLDPSDAVHFRSGEILVAPHTDPGWTPLFLSCKAVVTEIGGFLSHGATVAREYGVPCVVNASGAIDLIRTGDWIFVDGTRGQVEIYQQVAEGTQA